MLQSLNRPGIILTIRDSLLHNGKSRLSVTLLPKLAKLDETNNLRLSLSKCPEYIIFISANQKR
jgi:hypothetical protein